MNNTAGTPRLMRHFKGGLYIIEGFSQDEADGVHRIVYSPADGSPVTFSRPSAEISDDVSDREDNTTGQKYRFELIDSYKDITPIALYSTQEIVNELNRRSDNPFKECAVEGNQHIVESDYAAGIIRETSSLDKTGNPFIYADIHAVFSKDEKDRAVRFVQTNSDKPFCLLKRVIFKEDLPN